jgi:uncharacterized protein YdhG (YjbR/CyaY superfamily)
MEKNKPGFVSIDAYIATYPKEIQKKLKEIRRTIKAAAPKAQEKISYKIPAFTLNGDLVYFGAYTDHIGFYPRPTGGITEAFKKEMAKYASGRGTLKFPLDEPLPLKLITKVVKLRAAENLKSSKKKAEKGK